MKPWVLIIATLLQIHLCSGQNNFICLRDLEDYYQFGWDALIPELRPKYAETVADLPSNFHGRLEDAEGILYYAGSDFPADANIANSPSSLLAPVYLYIKYYAHQGSSASQAIAYVTPALVPDDGLSKNLMKADDYVWREEVVDIDPIQASTAQIASGMIAPEVGDFFLVDTMIIAYGSIMDMEQIKSLCPRKIVTTEPTTMTTEMTTTPATPAPPSSIINECIDTHEDFVRHSWQSLPPYNYTDSLLLSTVFSQNVTANGMFYFTGQGQKPLLVFREYFVSNVTRDYAYFYLKYMSPIRNLEDQQASVKPAEVNPGETAKQLPLSPSATWKETVFSLGDFREYVEIRATGFSSDDLLIIDKIALVAGNSLEDILMQIVDCVKR